MKNSSHYTRYFIYIALVFVAAIVLILKQINYQKKTTERSLLFNTNNNKPNHIIKNASLKNYAPNGQPTTHITSTYAVSYKKNNQILHLSQPKVYINKELKKIAVTAKEGVYNKPDNTIQMQNNATLQYLSKKHFNYLSSNTLLLNLNTSTLSTNDSIYLESTNNEISLKNTFPTHSSPSKIFMTTKGIAVTRANGFHLNLQNNELILKNKVQSSFQ